MMSRTSHVFTFVLMACLSILPSTVAFAADTSTDQKSDVTGALDISHAALVDLGIMGAADQVDRVITHAVSNINHNARRQLSPEQTLELQKLLREVSGSAFVGVETANYFADRLPEDYQLALEKMNNDLVLRVRNFDVSLEMKGAVEKYKLFEQNLALEGVAAERLELLERLDRALQISAIAAMLHTEITITAAMAAEKTAKNKVDADLLISSIGGKHSLIENHMAATLLKIHLFSYRFMPNQELRRYIEILEDDGVQNLLQLAQLGLRHAVQEGRDRVLRKQALTK